MTKYYLTLMNRDIFDVDAAITMQNEKGNPIYWHQFASPFCSVSIKQGDMVAISDGKRVIFKGTVEEVNNIKNVSTVPVPYNLFWNKQSECDQFYKMNGWGYIKLFKSDIPIFGKSITGIEIPNKNIKEINQSSFLAL